MEHLPSELLLHILAYLNPQEIALLRSISRQFYKVISDNELWRTLCFNQSSSERSRNRHALVFQASLPFQAHPQIQAFRRHTQATLNAHQAWINAQVAGSEASNGPDSEDGQSVPVVASQAPNMADLGITERARRLANWDPTYRDEQVDWQAEYIARNAPISCNWFQPARRPNTTADDPAIEARGLALVGNRHVIAPLEDDSLAIWNCDQNDTGSRGRLMQKSEPGLLLAGQKAQVSVTPTIASAITVDDRNNKAYVVVQNYLQEVDLNTMQVSASQHFPDKIAATSQYTNGVPLTIGTRSAVHLYDPRTQIHVANDSDHVESMSTYPKITISGNMNLLKSGNFDRFASLHQAGPTAIQHLTGSNTNSATGDIVVSGRFPSLLIYDRRQFPKLRTTLYSGAQLCGLATLPYAYSAVDAEIMSRGELSIPAAQESKSRPGHTLFACGEYNGRGALEIYGLSDSNSPNSSDSDSASSSQHVHTSTFKNRYSAAGAKILSIANHGTKLVMSDADGKIHWLERDGKSLIRRWNINDFVMRTTNSGASRDASNSIRTSISSTRTLEPSTDEAVLHLLPLPREVPSSKLYEDGILIWTGERIGLLSFSPATRFGGRGGGGGGGGGEKNGSSSDWREADKEEGEGEGEDKIKRREERVYSETMKRALQRQADEVRWLNGLGLGG